MANVAGLRGDWDAVVNAVKAVFGGNEFVLLAENDDAMKPPHFEWVNDLKTRHPRGRAFDPDREVRWRATTQGRFVVSYLSEQTPPPADVGFEPNSEDWETRTANQKLYGKWSRKTDDWVEVAVPGITRGYYSPLLKTFLPKSDTDPAPLEVATVDYLRNGLVQMTRYCLVQRHPEE